MMAARRSRNPDLCQHLLGELRRGGESHELRQLDQQLALALRHGEALGTIRQMECAGRAQEAGGPELDFLRGQMGLQSLVHTVSIRGLGNAGFTPGRPPDRPATRYAPGGYTPLPYLGEDPAFWRFLRRNGLPLDVAACRTGTR